jgi:hypothetical protein
MSQQGATRDFSLLGITALQSLESAHSFASRDRVAWRAECKRTSKKPSGPKDYVHLGPKNQATNAHLVPDVMG